MFHTLPHKLPAQAPAEHKDGDRVYKHEASFGFNDQRGRPIGYLFAVYAWTVSQSSFDRNPEFWGCVGPCFRLSVTVTRNGVGFGASQPTKYYKSLDEAKAAGFAALERSRKSNARKYA